MILRLEAERELKITPEFARFAADGSALPDVTAKLSWRWSEAAAVHTEPIARDKLLIYYDEGDYCCCELDGGDREAVARTQYAPDFSFVKCVINTDEFDVPQDTVRQILRMLPVRQMLLSRSILFLHAAQIRYRGKGILFAAPSGTGKTTQAKLWRDHRQAEIVCNDRTLLRKTADGWRTYGFPYDGSEPVLSDQINEASCIVVLKQGTENRIERLSPSKAIARLMPQTVIDVWHPQSRAKAMELILLAFADIPIYLFRCTADESTVTFLERTLKKDGIIS